MMERKYPRARFHDYNEGYFFVTVVTHQRNCYFGEIHGEVMHLSELGKCLEETLRDCGKHYHGMDVVASVVMPNHFHMIAKICSAGIDQEIKDDRPQNRGCLRSPQHPQYVDDFESRSHHNARLSVMVGGIKAAVKRYANRNCIPFAWQRNYHDRIIRDQREYTLIEQYITTNPQRWYIDCFHDSKV